MEYHRLKPRFNTAAYDPKRISFVYVLSQNEGKGPYKVGMSKGDLWRRMSNSTGPAVPEARTGNTPTYDGVIPVRLRCRCA